MVEEALHDTETSMLRLGRLTDVLGFLLRIAELQTYDDFPKQTADFRLKPGEFSVLTVIAENPGLRQGMLANRLSIKPAHMTKLIRRLEDRNLIVRRIPDSDRRAVELALSADGTREIAEHWQLFERHERNRYNNLAADEEILLKRLLLKFTGLDDEHRRSDRN